MNKNELVIDGAVYVLKSAVLGAETDHVIVIAERGWIFEGYKVDSGSENLKLVNANVVRSWSNGRGIGGLVKEEYKEEYTLDPVGTVEFAPGGVIAVISVEW